MPDPMVQFRSLDIAHSVRYVDLKSGTLRVKATVLCRSRAGQLGSSWGSGDSKLCL